MTRIILIAEIAERDIPSRIEIAKIIRNRTNYQIMIVEQELARILPGYFYRGSVVLDKSLADNKGKRRFFNKLKRNNAIILVEDQEANAMLTREYLYFQSRFSNDMLQFVDTFFVWTKNHYDTLIKYVPKQKHKLQITGSANYSYINSSVRNNINPEYILFNSNFSLLSNYANIDSYIDFRKAQCVLDSRMEKQLIDIWEKTEYRLELFCKEILSDINRGRSIKVRHHPSENPDGLKKLLSKHGVNYDVLPNISIIEDLKRAKMVKHIGCNSRLDAALAGIASYDIEKQKLDDPTIADEYKQNNGIENIAKNIIRMQAGSQSSNCEITLHLFSMISRVHQYLMKIKNGRLIKSRDRKWQSIKILKTNTPEIRSERLFIVL